MSVWKPRVGKRSLQLWRRGGSVWSEWLMLGCWSQMTPYQVVALPSVPSAVNRLMPQFPHL